MSRKEGGRTVRRRVEIFSLSAMTRIIGLFNESEIPDYDTIVSRLKKLDSEEKAAIGNTNTLDWTSLPAENIPKCWDVNNLSDDQKLILTIMAESNSEYNSSETPVVERERIIIDCDHDKIVERSEGEYNVLPARRFKPLVD